MAPPLRTAQPAEWTSQVPGRLAWLLGAALLYCDRAAPLLLSPQTGWHFGAAARWVWLSFAAAGQTPTILLCARQCDLAGQVPVIGAPVRSSISATRQCRIVYVFVLQMTAWRRICAMQVLPRGCSRR
jgi:hypothetical protein